jgi:lysophospholipase L1-like esterase
MRFLALGDSYTIGESVLPAERWPLQLAALLRKEGFALDEPQIVATTGWTTDELWAGIDRAAPRGPFELVSLLIGVNDQYRRREVSEYAAQFAVLLARASEFSGGQPGRVLVVSIPDWGVTPFARGRDRAGIGRAIDQFNTLNRDAAQHAGTHYVDVTPISRQAAVDGALIAGDGLHPSGKMYTEWARLALPAARAALQS